MQKDWSENFSLFLLFLRSLLNAVSLLASYWRSGIKRGLHLIYLLNFFLLDYSHFLFIDLMVNL